MQGFLSTLLIAATLAAPATAGERPNVVVFLTDDQGYGDLSCYGSDRVQTPNIDCMAAEGMRFTQFYAPASSCSPTRSATLTGRSPLRLGIYTYIPKNSAMHLKREERTIASILRDAGYTTCFVGKWGCNGIMGSAEQPQPDDHGFDYYLAAQNNATPSHKDPDCFYRNGTALGVVKGYSAQIIVDEAIGWLKTRQDQQKPFCLFVWFQEPHRVIATPEEFIAPYRKKLEAGELRTTTAQDTPKGQKEAPSLPEYLGNIAHVDHQVGRILRALEELGVAENTLALFTSDNGPIEPGSTGGLRGGKGTLWEGGIRMPGIVRWPARIKPGQTCDVPITGLDLLPTLCEVADVAPPNDRALDGESILPLLEGRRFQRTKPLFWWRLSGDAVLREGEWKLRGIPEPAKNFPSELAFVKGAQLEKFELYNLADDPTENNDIAAEHDRRVAAMRARLQAIHSEMQAEGERWPEGALPGPNSGKGGGKSAAKKARNQPTRNR
ncbi:MAG: sulfatase-like hydrolase/transferase [Planctomycetota bacterium]